MTKKPRKPRKSDPNKKTAGKKSQPAGKSAQAKNTVTDPDMAPIGAKILGKVVAEVVSKTEAAVGRKNRKHSQADFNAVIKRMRMGDSLNQITTVDRFMPKSVFYAFLDDPANLDQYNRAKTLQMDAFAEKIEAIIEEPLPMFMNNGGAMQIDAAGVMHRKNHVNALQWLMTKMAPKKWGDSSTLNLAGDGLAELILMAKARRAGKDAADAKD